MYNASGDLREPSTISIHGGTSAIEHQEKLHNSSLAGPRRESIGAPSPGLYRWFLEIGSRLSSRTSFGLRHCSGGCRSFTAVERALRWGGEKRALSFNTRSSSVLALIGCWLGFQWLILQREFCSHERLALRRCSRARAGVPPIRRLVGLEDRPGHAVKRPSWAYVA